MTEPAGERGDELLDLRARLERLLVEREALRADAAGLRVGLEQARAGAERGERFTDHVLATMSHELRTPLTTILGLTEALQDGVYGPLGCDAQRVSLRSVEAAGRALLAYVGDLLDLARLRGGRLALERTVIDVAGLCQAVVAGARADPNPKQLVLACDLDADVGQLDGDERRLNRVLAQLLASAAELAPRGGQVGLAARTEGDLVRITASVAGGPALSSETIARLSRPFGRVDPSLSSEHQDPGIGLALAEGLAQLHGGRLEIESGPGTRFSVLLPRTAPTSSARSRPWTRW